MKNKIKSTIRPAGKSKYALKVEKRKALARKLNQPVNTPLPVLLSCVETNETDNKTEISYDQTGEPIGLNEL